VLQWASRRLHFCIAHPVGRSRQRPTPSVNKLIHVYHIKNTCLYKTSTRYNPAIGIGGFGELMGQNRFGLAPELIGRVLLGVTMCLSSLDLRFYTNWLIFNLFSGLARENPCSPPFVFNMFSGLAFC